MHKLKFMGITLLLTSLAITPAFAKADYYGKGCETDKQRAAKFEHLKERINLTVQQEAEIKELIAASKEKNAVLFEENRATRKALREITRADTLDEPRLRELVRKQADQRAAMLIAKHATKNRINKILTPAQLAEQEAFRQQRQKHRHSDDCRQ